MARQTGSAVLEWSMSGMRLSMRVWDAPIRLFHWMIVILVVVSWYTAHSGRMELHFYSGYTILTLLLFRIGWGFIGSDTARFSRFLKNPLAGFRHLAHFPRREPDNEIGHNAAGGWFVLVLLGVLLFQAATGLFSNDDVVSQGPFADRVGKEISNQITHYHDLNFNIILAATGLHVLMVLLYAAIKRQDLVRPMVTGKKRLPATFRAPRMASSFLAAGLLVLCALIVWTVISVLG
jgi:cytochrome b